MEDGGVGESGDARLGTVLINAVFVYVCVNMYGQTCHVVNTTT